jgi:ubiquinone/menaquinone biosynthesis C-methylase UbiE
MGHHAQQTIKKQVRTYYGQSIRASAAAGCCTPSYGCGSPFDVADLKAGEVVLDLGSGAGLDAILAARQVGADGQVFGLDMTDEMIEIARRNAEIAGMRNILFLKGDIESIPLPTATVDAIISNCVVNLTPDKQAAYIDAYRVLKPGGRLAISDVVVDGDLEGLSLDEAQIREGLSWVACVAGAPTMSEVRTMLATAGFVDVAIAVVQRYSSEQLTRKRSIYSATLSDDLLQELEGRFTSSTISAVKPHFR